VSLLVKFPLIGHTACTGDMVICQQGFKSKVGVLDISLRHFLYVVAVQLVKLLGVFVDKEGGILLGNFGFFGFFGLGLNGWREAVLAKGIAVFQKRSDVIGGFLFVIVLDLVDVVASFEMD
jgi:hypothetical protein